MVPFLILVFTIVCKFSSKRSTEIFRLNWCSYDPNIGRVTEQICFFRRLFKFVFGYMLGLFDRFALRINGLSISFEISRRGNSL